MKFGLVLPMGDAQARGCFPLVRMYPGPSTPRLARATGACREDATQGEPRPGMTVGLAHVPCTGLASESAANRQRVTSNPTARRDRLS